MHTRYFSYIVIFTSDQREISTISRISISSWLKFYVNTHNVRMVCYDLFPIQIFVIQFH